MTSDERLRDLLHTAVDDLRPSPPDWEDVRTRGAATVAEMRSRRPLFFAMAAALVVAVGIAVALIARDEPDRTRVTHRPGPSTTTTPTSEPTPSTTTTTTTTVPAPRTFVATRAKSTRLVVADSTTGRTVRVLADYGPYREPDGEDPIGGSVIYGIALSPDGDHVYFTTGPEPAVGQLHRVSTAGGPVEDIGFGEWPAISPTGDRLAFVLDGELVVRDLRTKAERHHRPGNGVARTPVFSADSKWVVFEASESEYNELFVIDAELVGPPRPIRAESRKGGEFYLSPSPRAYDNLMGFIESCCDVDATMPPQPMAFVVVELPSGAVKGRLPLDKRMRRADYDVSGHHQLFVDEDGVLYRRSGGGLTRVTTDITFADW
jgi:hypothetical protein